MSRSIVVTPEEEDVRGLRNSSLPRRALTPWWFLGPTVLALIVGFGVPLLWVFRASLYDIDLAGRGDTFMGLNNFADVLSSSQFHNALIVSTKYTLGSLVGSLVLGLGTALLLNDRFHGRGVARSLILIPWAMPLVVSALIWATMFDPQFGVVNYALISSGIIDSPALWLSSPGTALIAVILIQIWQGTPFAAVMFLAGLQVIPHELYEAAQIDGAGWWARLRNVTLPGLRRVTTVITLFSGIWFFGRAFTIIFLLTAGGPGRATDVLTLRTYTEAFQFAEFGTASAYAVVVFVISVVLAALYIRVRIRGDQ